MLLGSTALSVIAVALTTIGVVKIASDQATNSLQAEVKNRLIIQRDTQKDHIEGYFNQINKEVSQQATIGGTFANALVEFSSAFPNFVKQAPRDSNRYKANIKAYYDEQFGTQFKQRNAENSVIDSNEKIALLDKNALALQNFYIAENAYPLGSKDKLETLKLKTEYSKIHSKYHARIAEYMKRHGFYDVFLVDAETGNLVYSVYKELDFATSMINGPYANTGIGEAFKLALGATEPGQTFSTDMKPYFPSYNDYASFISSPIYIDGKIKGVFMVQAPIDKINEVMTFNNNWAEYGLGESGETYIVANDKTMRNNSRFLKEDSSSFFDLLKTASFPSTVTELIKQKESTVGLMTVDSPGVNQALSGKSGFQIFPDYRDVPVLSAYTPLNIAGMNWVLLAEIDTAEAFAPVDELIGSIIKSAIMIGFGILLLGLLASMLFVRNVVSPITHFKETMDRFTGGEEKARVQLESEDEIGELARTFDNLLDEREATVEKMKKENDEINDSVISMLQVAFQLSQGDFTVKMDVAEDVTGTLSDSLNMVVDQTNKALGNVRDTASSVEHAANQVKRQSDAVKAETEKELSVVNKTVQDLTDASTELKSIVVLAKECNKAADETIITTNNAQKSVTDSVEGINNIRENIRETEKRIKRLGERSQEIGGVIELINGIAEKTHVLALNASMQAASAGEAGRGFAVVANEVQRLAENARDATLEISQQVKNIQVDTSDTMNTMNKVISQVVDGSNLAEKSGKEMTATRDKSLELVKLVQKIAKRSEVQAKVALNLQEQATEIKTSSAQTFEQMIEQTLQTENLVGYATELQKVISAFKILKPDENQSEKVVNS